MSKPILIIEKTLNSSIFADVLESKYNFVHQTLEQELNEENKEALLAVINIHLENPDNVKKTATCINKLPDIPVLFLVNDLNHPSTLKANELGADRILRRPAGLYDAVKESQELQALDTCLAEYIQKSTQNLWIELPANEREALQQVNSVNNEVVEAILSGERIPVDRVATCCDQLISSLNEACIGDWLDAVKTHHSYTHRHSITVTGLAIAFGMHFNMPKNEISKLATGGLMHDIGKIKIPLAILDKPGKLNEQEMDLIKSHPVHSAEILRMDDQFDDFIIDLALYHHEMLDGSGYPEGLSGKQISDSVRMLTIIDIFSALVDQRAYKKSMTGEEALNIMEKMEGKLDLELLRAFRPIALNIPTKAA